VAPTKIDAGGLRQLCLAAGADDVGLVEIGRAALDDQRDDILRYFPPTKTLISFVCRMNREPVRSPARSAQSSPWTKSKPPFARLPRQAATARFCSR
jgi:hypothetical protein